MHPRFRRVAQTTTPTSSPAITSTSTAGETVPKEEYDRVLQILDRERKEKEQLQQQMRLQTTQLQNLQRQQQTMMMQQRGIQPGAGGYDRTPGYR